MKSPMNEFAVLQEEELMEWQKGLNETEQLFEPEAAATQAETVQPEGTGKQKELGDAAFPAFPEKKRRNVLRLYA